MSEKAKKDEKTEEVPATEPEKAPEKEEGKAEEKAKQEESPPEPPPVAEEKPAATDPAPAETEAAPEAAEETDPAANLAEELAEARAQIAAYKSGMRQDVVDDAVYLAMRDVKKGGGTADEESVMKALKGVLKRHPEWQNDSEAAPQKGFRVGAEPKEDPAENEDIAKAFGNK